MEKLSGYISGSTLNLSVDNIQEFKKLLDEVIEKQEALNNVVQKLNRFNLRITFSESHSE
ncbi:MAG: hypothetical protein AB9921_06035 [Erysipelotrichaceae bacterium]